MGLEVVFLLPCCIVALRLLSAIIWWSKFCLLVICHSLLPFSLTHLYDRSRSRPIRTYRCIFLLYAFWKSLIAFLWSSFIILFCDSYLCAVIDTLLFVGSVSWLFVVYSFCHYCWYWLFFSWGSCVCSYVWSLRSFHLCVGPLRIFGDVLVKFMSYDVVRSVLRVLLGSMSVLWCEIRPCGVILLDWRMFRLKDDWSGLSEYLYGVRYFSF